MYWDNPSGTILTNAVQNTWYGVTNFTEGNVVGVTTDTSDATADHFTIPAGGGGDYVVNWILTAGNAATGEQVEFGIAVDGTVDRSTVASGTDNGFSYPTMSNSTILSLSASEEISMYHRNISGTGSVNVLHASITIQRISP